MRKCNAYKHENSLAFLRNLLTSEAGVLANSRKTKILHADTLKLCSYQPKLTIGKGYTLCGSGDQGEHQIELKLIATVESDTI